MREGPGLTGEVPEPAQRNAHLLTDFPADGFFEGLSRLDEPRDAGVHGNAEGSTPGEQRLAVSFDEGDDRRRQSRKGQQSALGTALGSLALGGQSGRAAPTAESMGALPFDQLNGATGERPLMIGQPSGEGQKGFEDEPVRGFGLHGHSRRPHRFASEEPEEEWLMTAAETEVGGRPVRPQTLLTHEDLTVTDDEPVRRAGRIDAFWWTDHREKGIAHRPVPSMPRHG